MHQLVNQDNLDFLNKIKFRVDDYYSILDEIQLETKENIVFDKDISALDNVKNIVRQRVDIYYSDKELLSGYYIYNKIYVNNNLSESQQIVTLIHEFTHHVYAEIFEKWLQRIFSDVNSIVIKSFVMFMLNNSIENRVADEYLSYIVESRFTPSKYHNFISFIQLLIDLNIDVDSSKGYFIFAHDVSHDIDDVFRSVFNEELCAMIENQFIVDNINPFNQKLTFDYSDEHYNNQEKVEIIQEMICFIFDFFINGEGDISDLDNYVTEFEKSLE